MQDATGHCKSSDGSQGQSTSTSRVDQGGHWFSAFSPEMRPIKYEQSKLQVARSSRYGTVRPLEYKWGAQRDPTWYDGNILVIWMQYGIFRCSNSCDWLASLGGLLIIHLAKDRSKKTVSWCLWLLCNAFPLPRLVCCMPWHQRPHCNSWHF